MRRFAGYVAAVALTLTQMHPAQAVMGYENGNSLLSLCTTGDARRCLGYIEGVSDAMDSGADIGGYRACLPPDMIAGQLRDVVLQFLYNDPAERHMGAVSLIAKALSKSFPCR
jgi:Rap1a immunity proteins